jgi:hypothetical protein
MPAPLSPAELVQQFFPGELLNFDTEATGPIESVFAATGEALAKFTNDNLLLQAQVAVQQASGMYLDLHGIAYDTLRFPGELDDPYRARILQALTSGRLTIPALQAAVVNYYASAYTTQPTILVWDLQSRPDLAAAYGIVRCQFVIDITFEVSPANFFFAGRSYANRNTFSSDGSFGSGGGFSASPDPNLTAIVQRYKAAAYQPVFRITRKFGNITIGAITIGAAGAIAATHSLQLNAEARIIAAHTLTLPAAATVIATGALTLYAAAEILEEDVTLIADGGASAGFTLIADGGTNAGDTLTTDGLEI